MLDPNATMVEPHASSTGLLVMQEILTIAGPTPDPDHTSQFLTPWEWCINTVAADLDSVRDGQQRGRKPYAGT